MLTFGMKGYKEIFGGVSSFIMFRTTLIIFAFIFSADYFFFVFCDLSYPTDSATFADFAYLALVVFFLILLT